MEAFYQNRDNFLDQIMATFPPVKLAVGYGSGVFWQAGNSSKRLIDMLLVVEDLAVFHRQNSEKNPSHYQGALLNRRPLIQSLNQNLFPLFYFTQNELFDEKYKYGVVSCKDFEADLKCWQMMSVAGRFQKPVHLIFDDFPNLQELMDLNRTSAVG